MIIKVVNLRKGKSDFKCDRTTALGNPFVLYSEKDRNKVCDEYEIYFQRNMNPDEAPPGFLEYLDEILQAAKKKDITLGCWCAPKRCHCDTIKKYLDIELGNNN